MMVCFGPDVADDKNERVHRFFEEAVELAQACNCSAEDAHKLVDYVYKRPKGDVADEVGGTLTTLSALCSAHRVNVEETAIATLDKNWDRVDAIRAKHATKPKFGPLPGTGTDG